MANDNEKKYSCAKEKSWLILSFDLEECTQTELDWIGLSITFLISSPFFFFSQGDLLRCLLNLFFN